MLFPDITADGTLSGIPSQKYSEMPKFYNIKLGPTPDYITQVRRKSMLPRYVISMSWDMLTNIQEDILNSFFMSCYGEWAEFTFFSADANKKWSNVALGTGDGFTSSFALGAKNVSNLVVMSNGTVLTIDDDYILSVGTGTDGQDEIIFGTSEGARHGIGSQVLGSGRSISSAGVPISTEVLTATYTGRRYFINCRFKEGALSRDLTGPNLYQSSLVIVGATS